MSRIAALLLLVAVCSFAQPPRAALTVDAALRRTGLRVAIDPATARSSVEFRIGWQVQAQAARVVQRIDRADPPPRQRSPEVSRDHLVIAFLDAAGTVRYTRIVVDPRLVRGEFPDAAGNLHKTEIRRADVELSVTAPGGTAADEVRIFAPDWDTGELRLRQVASARVPAAPRQ